MNLSSHGSILALLLTVPMLLSPPSMIAADKDFIGFNEHPERYDNYAQLIDRMADSQVKWVRLSPDWGAFQPKAPDGQSDGFDANYIKRFDDIVNRLTARGIQVDLILCYSAPWASSAPKNAKNKSFYPPAPSHMADWAHYVKFLSTRYKDKISTYEVWNEPDHPGFLAGEETYRPYLDLLKTAYVELKAVSSSNTVLMGGLGNKDGVGTWFDQLMGLGAGRYFDVINYHVYGDSDEMQNRYDDMMELVKKYGSALSNKPIWITEAGYKADSMTSAAAQYQKADFLDDVYLFSKQHPNIQKVFYYDFRDENGYGLVNFDSLAPYAAYYHVQAEGGAEAVFGSPPAGATTLSVVPSDAEGKDPERSQFLSSGESAAIPVSGSMYFQLNDKWLYNSNNGLDTTAYIDVTYLDSGEGTFELQYDGQTSSRQTLTGGKTGTDAWKTKTFEISDAKFANRLAYGADFRIKAKGEALIVKKVTVRKPDNIAKAMLNSTNDHKLMQLVTNSNSDAQAALQTYHGMESRTLAGNNRYLSFTVSNAIASPDENSVVVGLTYFDEGSDRIQIDYPVCAPSGGCSPPLLGRMASETGSVTIQKTNSKTWKYTQVTLPNTAFHAGSLKYGADIRIGNAGDQSVEHIVSVELIRN